MKATKRLSLLDATFIAIETRDTPMHVAGLQIYTIPEHAPENFVQQIVKAFRNADPSQRPWNQKLAKVFMGRLLPAFEQAESIDMGYHVQHTALPSPGGERELGELVSYLHGQTLDRSRPLWVCHVIEGLERGRFAIYCKIHHALMDGVSGIRALSRSLSTDSQDLLVRAPWDAPRRARRDKPAPVSQASAPWSEQLRSLRSAFKPLFKRIPDQTPVGRPFEAPRSALNGHVTAARRVAVEQLSLARMRQVAQAAKVTVNDVYLALCSAAIRRHLLDTANLPALSLTAGVPVSLRDEQEQAAGNAIGFLFANLGTDIADPRERLAAIHDSMTVSKNHLRSIPSDLRMLYTMPTMTPAILVLYSGLGAHVSPPFNITISNVPGPEHHLYLGGARLEAVYPISIPFQGQALNISSFSYAGFLNVGFTGSRENISHLQHLSRYLREALSELEQAHT